MRRTIASQLAAALGLFSGVAFGLFMLGASCDGMGPSPDMSAGGDDGGDGGGEDGGLPDLKDVDLRPPLACVDITCDNPTPICDPMPPCHPCANQTECSVRAARLGNNDKFCVEDRMHSLAGSCVPCLDANKDGNCAGGQTCKNYSCGSCSGPDDCTSGICDTTGIVPGKRGLCLGDAEVIHVNNRNGGSCTSGSGGVLAPKCTLAEGVDAVTPARRVIRLWPSTKDYGALTLSAAKTLVILGPGLDAAQTARISAPAGKDAVGIGAVVDLTLDGVDVNVGENGIVCTSAGSKLTVRRSRVTKMNTLGIDVKGCDLTLEQTRVSENGGGALRMESTTYSLTNNLIVDNLSPFGAVLMRAGATGAFRFNTVANNTTAAGQPGGINCGGSIKLIEDTIVFANSVTGSNSQLSNCMLTRVVVGTADMTAGGIRQDPSFENSTNPNKSLRDYRIKATSTCCVDAAPARGDLKVDHFGKPRPGAGGNANYDIGAHEVK